MAHRNQLIAIVLCASMVLAAGCTGAGWGEDGPADDASQDGKETGDAQAQAQEDQTASEGDESGTEEAEPAMSADAGGDSEADDGEDDVTAETEADSDAQSQSQSQSDAGSDDSTAKSDSDSESDAASTSEADSDASSQSSANANPSSSSDSEVSATGGSSSTEVNVDIDNTDETTVNADSNANAGANANANANANADSESEAESGSDSTSESHSGSESQSRSDSTTDSSSDSSSSSKSESDSGSSSETETDREVYTLTVTAGEPEPVENVDVTIKRHSDGATTTKTTGEDGQVTFDVYAGTYTVTGVDERRHKQAKRVTVPDQQSVVLDQMERPVGDIEGNSITVIDQNGEPVEGMHIEATTGLPGGKEHELQSKPVNDGRVYVEGHRGETYRVHSVHDGDGNSYPVTGIVVDGQKYENTLPYERATMRIEIEHPGSYPDESSIDASAAV